MFLRPPADAQLHTRLDQAFLKADPAATVESLRAQVDLAIHLQLRSLCVPPLLAGTVKKHNPQLRVSTVVAYPLGMESASCKYFAIEELMEQGIDEFDVVLDLFALVNGNMAKLAAEAGKLGTLCREHIMERVPVQPDPSDFAYKEDGNFSIDDSGTDEDPIWALEEMFC